MVNYGFISLTGKPTYLLVHAYNTHPLFERGNNGQHCAYYNRIFMVIDTLVVAYTARHLLTYLTYAL